MIATISTEDALAHAVTMETAITWHLTVVFTADDHARLMRLVDASNAERMSVGAEQQTAQRWLVASIPRWLMDAERMP